MPQRKRVTVPKKNPPTVQKKRGPKPDVKAQKVRFLAALRNVGTIRKACDRTKVPRASVNDWLESDAAFLGAFDLAHEDWIDSILDKMIALGMGTVRGKGRPNFTALVAILNAFHWDFKTIGQEAQEKRMFAFVDRIADIAAKYIAPADLEKFQAECSAAVDAALLGVTSKKGRRRE